jgi:flagellar protein FliO/FliZ
MPSSSLWSSLAWFIVILALIPLALWLLKRTPAGGASAQGLMRSVAVLPLAPNQRLVTVEVGRGEARRWLVLGVTAQGITALHEMAPQDDGSAPPQTAPPFSQLLARMQQRTKDTDVR